MKDESNFPITPQIAKPYPAVQKSNQPAVQQGVYLLVSFRIVKGKVFQHRGIMDRMADKIDNPVKHRIQERL
ncbi:hypothetical protein JW935_05065 [candidate division KSB1 bacterium]|nr:hypothetical protein [candidate division KSB1 bacterium]